MIGLLLSDQCQHFIKAAVFKGKDKNEFLNRKEFTGSLFKQIEEAYTFIDGRMEVVSLGGLVSGLEIDDIFEGISDKMRSYFK